MMMRPKSVTQYAPLVNEVVDDFLRKMAAMIDENGEIPDFKNELLKWSLECKNSL